MGVRRYVIQQGLNSAVRQRLRDPARPTTISPACEGWERSLRVGRIVHSPPLPHDSPPIKARQESKRNRPVVAFPRHQTKNKSSFRGKASVPSHPNFKLFRPFRVVSIVSSHDHIGSHDSNLSLCFALGRRR